jgi:hypothetical protein
MKMKISLLFIYLFIFYLLKAFKLTNKKSRRRRVECVRGADEMKLSDE